MKKQINFDELNNISGGAYTGPLFPYVIKKGDRIEIIARKFHTTVPLIKEINHLVNTDVLFVGKTLYIPAE